MPYSKFCKMVSDKIPLHMESLSCIIYETRPISTDYTTFAVDLIIPPDNEINDDNFTSISNSIEDSIDAIAKYIDLSIFEQLITTSNKHPPSSIFTAFELSDPPTLVYYPLKLYDQIHEIRDKIRYYNDADPIVTARIIFHGSMALNRLNKCIVINGYKPFTLQYNILYDGSKLSINYILTIVDSDNSTSFTPF